MKQSTVSDVRASIVQGTSDQPVQMYVNIEGNEALFLLTHQQAEVLLYDLHPVVQTLRGIAKKLPLFERLRAAIKVGMGK